MDVSLLLSFSLGALSAALVLTALREAPKAKPAALIGQCLRIEPGSVVLLEATRPVSKEQYTPLRAYLDEIEKHTGAKLALIDGALRVAAVRSSE